MLSRYQQRPPLGQVQLPFHQPREAVIGRPAIEEKAVLGHALAVGGEVARRQAGLAEREVQIAEQQGRLVASIVRAILGDEVLALSPAQLERASEVVSRHFRLVGPSDTSSEAQRGHGGAQ